MWFPVQWPTALAQMSLPWNLLVWLTVWVPFNQMDMLICPPKSQIASLTGHPDQCVLCGVPLGCGAGLNGRASQNICAGILCFSYTWEFPCSVGNKDPFGNAHCTPPLRLHWELQSWFAPTMPSSLIHCPLSNFYDYLRNVFLHWIRLTWVQTSSIYSIWFVSYITLNI